MPGRDGPSIVPQTLSDDARALLDFVDEQAKHAAGTRANKRTSPRRRLRATCILRYAARDGVTVLTATARARDVTRAGLGLVTNRHVPPNAAVHLTVRLRDGREFSLAGEVVHVRCVRGEWYLLGIRFRALQNDRLLPPERKRCQEDF